VFNLVENIWYNESSPLWHDVINFAIKAVGCFILSQAQRRCMQTWRLEVLYTLEQYAREGLVQEVQTHANPGGPRPSLIFSPRVGIVAGYVSYVFCLFVAITDRSAIHDWAYNGTSTMVNHSADKYSSETRVAIAVLSRLALFSIALACGQAFCLGIYCYRWVVALQYACQTWCRRVEDAIMSLVGCALTDKIESEHEALVRPMEISNETWSISIGMCCFIFPLYLFNLTIEGLGMITPTEEYQASLSESGDETYLLIDLTISFFAIVGLFFLAGISDSYRVVSQRLQLLRYQVALARALPECEMRLVLESIVATRATHGFFFFNIMVTRTRLALPSPPGTSRTRIAPPPRTNRTHVSPHWPRLPCVCVSVCARANAPRGAVRRPQSRQLYGALRRRPARRADFPLQNLTASEFWPSTPLLPSGSEGDMALVMRKYFFSARHPMNTETLREAPLSAFFAPRTRRLHPTCSDPRALSVPS